METRLRLGISECLLGHNVRYDGQHKHDRYLTDTLGQFVEYVPVCPEVECGLGVPRESMHLEGDPDDPRLVTTRSGTDHTKRMQSWAARRVKELASEDLCGFIFKAKSPSSGMERVKVYNGKGGISGSSPGLFAREFMRAFPLLPAEEEGRLHDVDIRENFIERIFTLWRYREGPGRLRSVRSLVAFQSQHKLLLMAHSPKGQTELGRMVANAKRDSVRETLQAYEDQLLRVLSLRSTPPKHVNVLQHIQGYFKKELSADEKQELGTAITHYREGLLPLIVPVTLVSHYARKFDVPYLLEQVYLDPHPLELKLRNHA